MMKYRVFNKHTKEDITTRNPDYPWLITPDGELYFNNYGDFCKDSDAIAIPENEVEKFLRSK